MTNKRVHSLLAVEVHVLPGYTATEDSALHQGLRRLAIAWLDNWIRAVLIGTRSLRDIGTPRAQAPTPSQQGEGKVVGS